MSTIAISDLARAAYCPRQLYYARRRDAAENGRAEPPSEVQARQGLAFRYPELRRADDATLAAAPIALDPAAYRAALDRLATRADWDVLADPPRCDVLLEGKECRGVAHKIVPAETVDDAPVPTFVSPGDPPEEGVWEHQRVRAVALAKALAWERTREVRQALVEYPAHGVVRRVRLTTRNKAAYRAAVRTVRALDGPPPRLRNDPRCDGCDFRAECGVRTRSLRSLLGL